jgi:hypothetical protein
MHDLTASLSATSGLNTERQWLPVSEEGPVAIRSLGADGYELALHLKQLPHLPPDIRLANGSGPGAVVAAVAAAVVAAFNPPV